jgi:hypothetical protein
LAIESNPCINATSGAGGLRKIFMEKPKGFADRVEKWLSGIPGVRTYRDREHRREVDKDLREQLASRLQEMRFTLKQAALHFSHQGELEPLSEIDRLSSRLQQMGDTIRFARYGYGGIFDLEKIREEELERLHTFDLSLMETIEGIQAKVEGMEQENFSDVLLRIREADGLLTRLEEKFRQRNEFMARPA